MINLQKVQTIEIPITYQLFFRKLWSWRIPLNLENVHITRVLITKKVLDIQFTSISIKNKQF